MTDSNEIRNFQQRYEVERPIYHELATAIQTRLEDAARQKDFLCWCSSREKDSLGMLKKVLRKNYSGYDNITDKAAARMVVPDLTCLEAAQEIVTSSFQVVEHSDKLTDANVQELGYRGIHFLVKLPFGESLVVDGKVVKADELVCEVQIHTRALNLWNDATHDLLYKPLQDLPSSYQRRLYRLVALVEIFDEQLAETLAYLRDHPESEEMKLLANLEPHFIRLAGMQSDRLLSLEILESLKSIWENYDHAVLAGKIDQFVENRTAKLIHFFDEHRAAIPTNPVALQPESIFILKEIEENSFRLVEAWNSAYPFEILDSLASTWGVDIGEE